MTGKRQVPVAMDAARTAREKQPRVAVTAQPVTVDAATAALMLGLSQRTVWSMAGTGELPCLHIGSRLLFRVEALAAFAAERETAEQEARIERGVAAYAGRRWS